MSVTTQANIELSPDPDAGLIRNGRYWIVPEGETKAVAHTRVTNFARETEDTFSLMRWQKRMTMLGTAVRSDIQVAAIADADDKIKLDALAEAAMDAAKANVARETGSSLHRICERADAGEAIDLPEPWASDLAAYRAELDARHVEVLADHIENVVVQPTLRLAGRYDRIVRIKDMLYVLDLKTGKDLSYSWGSIAIQLALYASSATIYDDKRCVHRPMPDVDQEIGLILHLPAGSGTAQLFSVDLASGHRGIELVQVLKSFRKDANRFAGPYVELPRSKLAPEGVRNYVATRVEAIIGAGKGTDLAERWPQTVPTLKARHDHDETELDMILSACNTVETLFQMPFPDIEDPRLINQRKEKESII